MDMSNSKKRSVSKAMSEDSRSTTRKMMTSAIENVSVADVRKYLSEIRHQWISQTHSDPFYITSTLSNDMSLQEFAFKFQQGRHNKRHAKGKTFLNDSSDDEDDEKYFDLSDDETSMSPVDPDFVKVYGVVNRKIPINTSDDCNVTHTGLQTSMGAFTFNRKLHPSMIQPIQDRGFNIDTKLNTDMKLNADRGLNPYRLNVDKLKSELVNIVDQPLSEKKGFQSEPLPAVSCTEDRHGSDGESPGKKRGRPRKPKPTKLTPPLHKKSGKPKSTPNESPPILESLLQFMSKPEPNK